MGEYEFVDQQTGELKSIETKVDINLIQEYNEWVIENSLMPPKYGPVEFAEYVQTRDRLKALDRGLEMIERYRGVEVAWTPEMVQSLVRILRNEE